MTPYQIQALVDRAWEVGYFKGPHERQSFEELSTAPPLALREKFQALTGIWPDEDLVEWWRADSRPKLKIPREGGSWRSVRERQDFEEIVQLCWNIFVKSIDNQTIFW